MAHALSSVAHPLPTLPAALRQLARLRGRQIGLRHKRLGIWQEFSWQTLADAVARLVSRLAGLGLGQGDTLLVLSSPRPEALLLTLAAQTLGAEVTALDPLLPPASLTPLVQCAAPRLVFAEGPAQLAQAQAALGADVPVVYADGQRLGKAAHAANRVAYAQALTSPPADASILAIDPDAVAFRFLRLSDEGIEQQTLSHAFLLGEAAQLIASEGLQASDSALAARAFAATAQVRYLLAPWLVAGFALNFPENLATRDHDRRELGPTLVAGTLDSYGRLAALVQARLPDSGHWQRWLVDWALAPAAGALRRGLGYWLVRRPLLDVLGLIHTRHPLLIGPPLSADAERLFAALGVKVRTLPDLADWRAVALPVRAADDFAVLAASQAGAC